VKVVRSPLAIALRTSSVNASAISTETTTWSSLVIGTIRKLSACTIALAVRATTPTQKLNLRVIEHPVS
jgi:hypothetical protein